MLRTLALLACLAAASCGAPGGALDAVKNDLIDPFSAQFRNVREVSYGWCGEVNAKNRMGGYVGWRLFHVSKINGEWSASIQSGDNSDRLDAIVNRAIEGFCDEP